jgi:hypothetical protein
MRNIFFWVRHANELKSLVLQLKFLVNNLERDECRARAMQKAVVGARRNTRFWGI